MILTPEYVDKVCYSMAYALQKKKPIPFEVWAVYSNLMDVLVRQDPEVAAAMKEINQTTDFDPFGPVKIKAILRLRGTKREHRDSDPSKQVQAP